MRTTIVPAQMTTVEDRIAGNLNFTQIFLLVTALLLGSLIYITLPPYLHFAYYKMPLICLAVFVCCSLALRIKGKVVIQWLVIFMRYTSRPRHYICNKNDSYNRNIFSEPRKKTVNKQAFVHKKAKETSQQLAVTDAIELERVINHPQANLRFKFAKKGGMYVSVSQIK